MEAQIDLTQIIVALIALISGVITAFVAPWLKNKLGEQKYSQFLQVAKIGVAAAEQIYKGSGLGEQKKAYVLDYLASKGYKVDTEEVNNTIEALVNQINTYDLEI